VEIRMPTKQPHGQELTLAQHVANQALHHRPLRIEHVNSSVQRYRMVKDRIRLRKQGIGALVMDICGALHHFRVRLTPWQPVVEAGYTHVGSASRPATLPAHTGGDHTVSALA
jgi:hypothetical protein